MAKQTTYQRLKAENLQLKKDIRNILKGDFMDKQLTIEKWETSFQLEDCVWAGSVPEMKTKYIGTNG